MQTGYLVIETRLDHPDRVYVETRSSLPSPTRTGLRFAARFADIDAALMHFHESVRRSLKGLEPRQYQIGLDEAIAVADAIDLDHRAVFIDPDLVDRVGIRERTAELRQRHRHNDWWLQAIGIFALLLLIALAFLPL